MRTAVIYCGKGVVECLGNAISRYEEIVTNTIWGIGLANCDICQIEPDSKVQSQFSSRNWPQGIGHTLIKKMTSKHLFLVLQIVTN